MFFSPFRVIGIRSWGSDLAKDIGKLARTITIHRLVAEDQNGGAPFLKFPIIPKEATAVENELKEQGNVELNPVPDALTEKEAGNGEIS